MTTQLTPHFSVEDFENSDTASRNNIDNTIPEALMGNVKATAELLERVRCYLSAQAGKDIPILVSSGFRCVALNIAVGSHSGSDHLLGNAADCKAPSYGTPYNIAQVLAPMVDALGIGQLIYEFDSWVHISIVKPVKPMNRILTINRNGTFASIVK